MIEIDASEGEGGGQVVRTSLALAALTGSPIRLLNIRGKRKKPGLLRQHLTAVRAMNEIASGSLTGAELGSRQLEYHPGEIIGGDFQWEVGSAGSAVLVAQTVLPALLLAPQPSTVRIGGGTHASWAPAYDFFSRVFLPLLAKMNASVTSELESYGFYPAGGGSIRVSVQPWAHPKGISIVERIGEPRPNVRALVARIPESVGERECGQVVRKMGWPSSVGSLVQAEPSGGPGNAVVIELEYDNITELFVEYGKVGVKAEQVARRAAKQAKDYLAREVPVGSFLADQLILPMAIAAQVGSPSEFATGALSSHALTQMGNLERFPDFDHLVISTEKEAEQRIRVRVASPTSADDGSDHSRRL